MAAFAYFKVNTFKHKTFSAWYKYKNGVNNFTNSNEQWRGLVTTHISVLVYVNPEPNFLKLWRISFAKLFFINKKNFNSESYFRTVQSARRRDASARFTQIAFRATNWGRIFRVRRDWSLFLRFSILSKHNATRRRSLTTDSLASQLSVLLCLRILLNIL